MQKMIQMQNFTRSLLDRSRLCSFDQEVIDGPTSPLIHQEARFWLILSGNSVLKLQGKEYILKKGCFVSVLPWQITDLTQVTETLQYYIVIYHFDTLQRLIKTFYDYTEQSHLLFEDMNNNPVQLLDDELFDEVKRAFDKLRDEVGVESTLQQGNRKRLFGMAVMNRLVDLCILFVREVSQDKSEKCVTNRTDKQDILRYMYLNCNKKLTLKQISQVFFCSESTISSYLSKTTGLSFFDLINEMRIAKTANYLLYTDFTLDELAEIMGYVDASHISKVFSMRIGDKIGEYRKTYQNVSEMCRFEESRAAYAIVNYIYRNYSENLSALNVADKFKVSINKLNRILISQVEKNFDDYLNSIRINKACEIISSADSPLIDVAIQVGYNNAKTFTRNFLRYKVMTPNEFKRKVVLQHKTLDSCMKTKYTAAL